MRIYIYFVRIDSKFFYKLLSKKEKKIKKNQFLQNSSYLLNHYLKKLVMDEEKKWLLMTYYCPTHGDSGFVKPIQLTKKEISKTFFKKTRSSKINFLK